MVDLLAETLLVAAASLGLWRLAALDDIGERVRVRLPGPVQNWLSCPWCSGLIVVVAVAVSWAAWQGRLGVDTLIVIWAARWIVGTVAARNG